MEKTPLAIPVLIMILSCSSGAPPADIGDTATDTPPAAAAASVPESEIGLAAGTAFEQPPQAPIAFNRVDPGESELRPRPNDEFPPAIPHSIEDLDTITLAENTCLECHDPEMAPDMGVPALPKSHQVDLRRTLDIAGDEPVGARWVCTSCHLAQTDTEPLVANTVQH